MLAVPEEAAMTMHYGPTWAWDQSRPEAIEAHRQVAEFHNGICEAHKLQQAAQARREIVENLLAKHFRPIEQVLDW
jgi:hypothetical protein